MKAIPVELDALPLATPVPQHLEHAAHLLDHALKVGCKDPLVVYLLGLAYKRQGKYAEARNAFRKIENPDANVLLQLGLLALEEQQFEHAEEEFLRSFEMDPASYEAGFNLFLARLSQGKMEECAALLPKLATLAPSPEEQRFLGLLEPLFRSTHTGKHAVPPPVPRLGANGEVVTDSPLAAMTAADEERLLQILRNLGQLDAVYPLLHTLALARPSSPAVQEAFLEVVLVQAKKHVDRCQWEEAERQLAPLVRTHVDSPPLNQTIPRAYQVALLNLLGSCECMLQDFDRAARYFWQALKLAGNDPWLHQNLALTYEWQGRMDLADTSWNRYFDLLDKRVPVPPIGNYLELLAYEGMSRLADSYSKKEKWASAVGYLQRASRMRPQDVETLERLFHLYNQVKRQEDARRTLRRLRELRPHEPQFELYELDLREVKTLEDIETMLGDIRRTLSKYPNDARVEERAVHLVANVIPLMGRLCDQLTDQLSKIVEQVRRLPNYQINWPAVHDVMRDLHREFQRLRRITNKCLGLVTSEEHRRIIRDLSDHIDRKIELCQSMGG